MLYDQFSDSSADECLVGNDDGINFLKGNRRLERELSAIHETLTSLKGHAEKTDQTIQHHEQEIEQLRLFSVGARKIRNRFLENEKRQLENTSAPHRRIVEQGNALAHEPVALLDAYLYVEKERNDADTYIRIYGIPPERVVVACKFILTGEYLGSMLTKTDERGYRQHIEIINRFASIMRRRELTPLIIENYETYIETLEDFGSDNDHHDYLSTIGKASALFWKAVSER